MDSTTQGVVAAIGSFIAVTVVFAAIYVICRLRRQRENQARVRTRTVHNSDLSSIEISESASFDPTLNQISMAELLRATQNFATERIIGDGSFGLVYKAELNNGLTVAVKKLGADAFQGYREFLAEMETLSKLQHPNIVKILGYYATGSDRILVYEFIEKGNLDQWLYDTSSSSSSSVSSPKSFLKSTVSANPLQNPLSLNPRRPSEPSNTAGLRRASIVWFRNDLRVHDNECLSSANNESVSVLPVYCFDPRDYGKSSSGFDKTGPYRAAFLIESVSDLRKNLQARGSDLVVRIGKPETVLAELVKEVGADAVYSHREVSHDEVKAEEKIEAALKDEGVEVKYFWGSTLYHVDDLPFKLEEMPTNYGGFKEKVQGLEIRKTIAALDQLRGLPARGDVEPGEIPSLVDLGLNPSATMGQDGKSAANASLVGGETEALQRLSRYAAECQAQPHKGPKNGNNDSIYGANFSCKISPWLAMGCLSPRSMFDELKKSTSRIFSAASNQKDGGSGSPSDTSMNWLMYELLWRDFFRFITKKYSSVKHNNAAPVTACTGVAA